MKITLNPDEEIVKIVKEGLAPEKNILGNIFFLSTSFYTVEGIHGCIHIRAVETLAISEDLQIFYGSRTVSTQKEYPD